MHDRILALEQRIDVGREAQVDKTQRRRQTTDEALVRGQYLVSSLHELLAHHRTELTGRTRYQDFHETPLVLPQNSTDPAQQRPITIVIDFDFREDVWTGGNISFLIASLFTKKFASDSGLLRSFHSFMVCVTIEKPA
jgi:hypothetical protein